MATTERCHAPCGCLLHKDILPTQWPIIYSTEYNIAFLGLEKLHPFDSGKWGRVFEFLKEGGMVRDDTIVRPDEAQTEDLLKVHSQRYLNNLKCLWLQWSVTVASITEVPPVALLPNFIVQRKVLRPFRYQTGGTILAGKLAMERGWAINIGGGFHHCSGEKGGGFCAYADISLCIHKLFTCYSHLQRVMIIDLDAHQGNGYERDFMDDQRVFILDMFNRGIYPHDGYAKRAIKRKVELPFYIEDEEYLTLVNRHVEGALNEFNPQLVVYNAGTDILDGDALGCMSISPQGVMERDRIVFEKTRSRNIPLVMVLSGGYQKTNARIIADSILNLHRQGYIQCEEAEHAPPVSVLPRSSSDGGLWSRWVSRCSTQDSSPTETSENPNTKRESSMNECSDSTSPNEDSKNKIPCEPEPAKI